MLTPNKVVTKEKTKSEKFGISGIDIKSERLIRVAKDDNFVSKNSKISEIASKGSKKE